jgi:2-keto-4-pentenoate hydratase/2-oxohepta-3-ene-1,7-dioic acid hydratase in catechol pathway
MRFVKARTADGPRVGVLTSDGTVALSANLHDLGAAIAASPGSESPVRSLHLIKPVTPPSMRDFMVFEEHIAPAWRREGMQRGPDVWYEQPIGYFSNAASLLGPREPIEIPGESVRLDFELEVGAVVSRTLRSASQDEAEAAIAGYLILCDWSARDTQFREMEGRLGPFKGKDFATSLGPIFVTPDELAPRRSGTGYDLLMTASVNGREYGHDHWSSAYWSFPELISYSSWNSVVEAGALIGSGTCQGGCILELSIRHSPDKFPYLTAGDHVSLKIETLGEITATIQPARRGQWPGVRKLRNAS